MTGGEYAKEQTGKLLERLRGYIEQTAQDPNADAVHDLRVTIRRFKAAMRTFEPMFEKRAVKRIRRKLDVLMAAAGEVRDRDIAIELLEKAGVTEGVATLACQREGARFVLRKAAEATRTSKWSGRLGL